MYLDKTVGKIVGELDKVGLRENTLILFSTDDGTATVRYQEVHDPMKKTGMIGTRPIYGHKVSSQSKCLCDSLATAGRVFKTLPPWRQ